jgi:hypothetical protein
VNQEPEVMVSDVQCARCGSSMYWESCWQCGGYQRFFGNEDCRECDGKGGAYFCFSGHDWCMAHPRPGREQTKPDPEFFDVMSDGTTRLRPDKTHR